MEAQRPALATVDIATDWTPATRSLSVSVKGKQLLPVATPDSVRLYVFLTEDSLYSETQAGARSGFYHSHVPRVSLTPTWGEKVDIASGYDCHFDTVLSEEWNEKQMSVVAFVANYNSTNPLDCSVLNVEGKSLIASTSGIGSMKHETSGLWTITHMSGKTVAKGSESAALTNACNALCHGVYVVSVNGKSRKICK